MVVDNVLVFPCGSEVGLEVHASLKWEKSVHLIGGSSVEDHGRFVFEDYVGDLPKVSAPGFVEAVSELAVKREIAFIFPAMDAVALALTQNAGCLHATVVSSPYETNRICCSKRLTYTALRGLVPTPKLFEGGAVDVGEYPVFLKPDAGYGSRGTAVAQSAEELRFHTRKDPSLLAMEYLPGKEYTVDCFTDFTGKLRYAFGRERCRIRTGIAVNSKPARDARFWAYAEAISRVLAFNGAWFYQVKEKQGELVLMEVATRIAGTMALSRVRGVNLPALSILNAKGYPVEILQNEPEVEIDRALVNRFRLDYRFDTVYVDFDDTLVVNGRVNADLVKRLYEFVDEGKRLVLLTRHAGDLAANLKKRRLDSLFDEVFSLGLDAKKSAYVTTSSAIFIDDSFRERLDVAREKRIPCYSPNELI